MIMEYTSDELKIIEYLKRVIAHVDNENSYWGGPQKLEYPSAPEILSALRAGEHRD